MLSLVQGQVLKSLRKYGVTAEMLFRFAQIPDFLHLTLTHRFKDRTGEGTQIRENRNKYGAKDLPLASYLVASYFTSYGAEERFWREGSSLP